MNDFFRPYFKDKELAVAAPKAAPTYTEEVINPA